MTAAGAADKFLRPGTLQLGAPPPLSVYVHLPWCLKKCPYCDFNSHELGASKSNRELPEQQYLSALRADLEASLPLVWGRTVQTVFIGGGTPSLFSPAGIERLLSDLRSLLPLAPGCEITLEANPGTFERERFKAFRAAGVTRLSIGVQSFDDAKLKALGRVHDRAQALAAIEEAASAFDTFNLDLMYALPGQTLAELETDVRTALGFQPPHLSLYHLTLEPNTAFALKPPMRMAGAGRKRVAPASAVPASICRSGVRSSRIQKARPEVAATRSFSWTRRSVTGTRGRLSWNSCQRAPPSKDTYIAPSVAP